MLKRALSGLLAGLSLLAVLGGCIPAAPAPAGPTPMHEAQGVAYAAPAETPTAAPVAPATAVVARPLPTAPTGQMLAGQVLWGANPVGGVRVELRVDGCRFASASQVVATTASDAQGQYVFLTPPTGDYALCAVWPDGEQNQGSTPHVQISAGQSIPAGPATTLKLARSLQMLEPADAAEVDTLPTLRWQEFPGIAAFRVMIVNSGTTALELDQMVTGTTLKLDVPLQPGARYGLIVLGQNADQDVLAVVNSTFATVGVAPTPAPDPRGSSVDGVPPDCQPMFVAGSALYAEPNGRYCFLYPGRFEIQTSDLGQKGVELAVFGPALDESADPLRAAMALEVSPLAVGADLKGTVDAFLEQFKGMNVAPIKRQEFVLGGGPAELLQGVPGRGGSRDIFALNYAGDRVYHLIFTPSVTDFPQAAADVEELFQTVSEHFAFTMPGPEGSMPAAEIAFSYPAAVAEDVRREVVPAEQSGSDGPWWMPVPEHAEVSLVGYPLTGTAQAARIIVYGAREFAAMNAEAGQRISGLEKLLQTKPAKPDGDLPFLPLLNAAQEMHAGVKYLSFAGGQGVRYLTQYGQGPVNNHELFYTFQGLTGDGEYYVAAILPVSHSLLPADFEMMSKSEREAIRGRLEQYLIDSDANFKPGLSDLDALVMSIKVN